MRMCRMRLLCLRQHAFTWALESHGAKEPWQTWLHLTATADDSFNFEWQVRFGQKSVITAICSPHCGRKHEILPLCRGQARWARARERSDSRGNAGSSGAKAARRYIKCYPDRSWRLSPPAFAARPEIGFNARCFFVWISEVHCTVLKHFQSWCLARVLDVYFEFLVFLACVESTRELPRSLSLTLSSASAVVVGAGIVGVAIADALARHGCKVTVVDRHQSARGEATPASWAWVNANSKKPKEYRELNMLVRVPPPVLPLVPLLPFPCPFPSSLPVFCSLFSPPPASPLTSSIPLASPLFQELCSPLRALRHGRLRRACRRGR